MGNSNTALNFGAGPAKLPREVKTYNFFQKKSPLKLYINKCSSLKRRIQKKFLKKFFKNIFST